MIGRPNESLMVGARLLGFNLRRTLLGNPNESIEADAAKADALSRVLDVLKAQGVVQTVPPFAGLPRQTQQAAALVLNAMLRALVYRRLAFEGISNLQADYEFVAGMAPGNNDDIQDATFDRLYQIMKETDMPYLLTGGHDLVLACQAAATIAKQVPKAARYDFVVQTKWGLVRLHGGEDALYKDVPTLLVIDTGGRDKYVNVPSNASAANWASVVIDTDGPNTYLSDPALEFKKVQDWPQRKIGGSKPGPAGALFGYSILIDGSGKGVFRSSRPAFGSGRFGVGVLEASGGDVFDGYCDSEGFGMFGEGILEEQGGGNRYDGFLQVQGVGQTMGFGYLVDRVGGSTFTANDTVIDFPSAQSAQHNTSMAQGAGNGRRADYLEAHALSGGIGILFAQAGDNVYSCAVFGQGAGYWNGVGMLWGSPGRDQYNGLWYVQGAAAHFAIGYLDDLGGDDSYSAAMNMAQGAGHDFSVGMLYDRGGSDQFFAPSLSLGAGNENGMGVFIKDAGNAEYRLYESEDPATHKPIKASPDLQLGKASDAPKASLRSRALCLGLFLDLAGKNSYPPETPWATPGTRSVNWTTKGFRPEQSQLGIFWGR